MDKRSRRVQSITQNLRVLFKAVQAHSKFVEKECGLSSAKLWMLYELGNSPGLKVSELAAALAIHPSTCSNMLDKLEERGLISRDRSKLDQRAVHLYLTRAGELLLTKAPKPAQGKLSGALGRLSDDTLASLESGLEGLLAALQDKDESAALVPIPGE